jgi:hypothetical protein
MGFCNNKLRAVSAKTDAKTTEAGNQRRLRMSQYCWNPREDSVDSIFFKWFINEMNKIDRP